jgi:hypothetical protein
MVHKPLNDLNRAVFSPRPEPEDNESVRDLKNEDCSKRLDVEPSEALRALARPLVSDPERPSE